MVDIVLRQRRLAWLALFFDLTIKDSIMTTNETFPTDIEDKSGRLRRNDLHGAIDRAADQAQPLADRLATRAHAGVDKVGDGLDAAATSLAERRKQTADAYRQFAESSRTQVRSSPLTSVLVAAAAGYALSKLFSARK